MQVAQAPGAKEGLALVQDKEQTGLVILVELCQKNKAVPGAGCRHKLVQMVVQPYVDLVGGEVGWEGEEVLVWVC